MLDKQNLNKLAYISQKAGELIMSYYNNGKDHQTNYKADNSPLTIADVKANELICNALADLFPDIQVISEENASSHSLSPGKTFFLVDPLDGTKSFVRGNGNFTVNIGLIHNSIAVTGVVYEPVLDELYYASSDEAWFVKGNEAPQRLSAIESKGRGNIALISHSHAENEQEMIKAYGDFECKPVASSYKFCVLAAGRAEIYPRSGPTMEWDTAAGHAILNAVGGEVVCYAEGGTYPMLYGKHMYKNGPFIALQSKKIVPKGCN